MAPKPYHRRRRSFPIEREFEATRYINETSSGTPSFTVDPGGVSVVGYRKQVTDSEGHNFDRSKGRFESGGPFETRKVEFIDAPRSVKTVKKENTSGTKRQEYSGFAYFPLSHFKTNSIPQKPNAVIPNPEGFASEADLKAEGSTAIARCSPINPAYDVGLGIGELMKDRLPSLPIVHNWQKGVQAAKQAGGDYLSTQFGWLPLINSMEEMGDSVIKSDDIIKQYQAQDGARWYREYDYDVTETIREEAITGYPQIQVDHGNPFKAVSPSKGVVSHKVRRKVWFRGLFTMKPHYLEQTWDNIVEGAGEFRRAAGLDLTPDLVWELTPWSWAIDWFSNVGDVLTNITNFQANGLVLRYGYIMEEILHEQVGRLDTCALLDAESRGGPSAIVRTTNKRRIPASPYGFGVSWDELSSFQASIVAALGISRL